MRVYNKFKGLTGAELLGLCNEGDYGYHLTIGDLVVNITPMTLPFANQAEASSIDNATVVCVNHRFMRRSILVRV